MARGLGAQWKDATLIMQDIDHWLAEMANAATRLAELGALEGTAGNISLFLPHDVAGLESWLHDEFPRSSDEALPERHGLPSGTLLITGTGRRLRDLGTAPQTVLCALDVNPDGSTSLHRSAPHGVEPTSEIDSHLAIHALHLKHEARVHAVIHAQPRHLTWLSHVPAYRDQARLNRQLLRWQPETIVTFPEGIGVLPYETPGTIQQGKMTADAMRQHRLVVWSKHGVVARSDRGPLAAADLVDYAEAAAEYEALDLSAGRPADGLSLDELRGIAQRFGVPTAFIDTLPERILR
jgi:rhamnulose-1-phosphate aldolase